MEILSTYVALPRIKSLSTEIDQKLGQPSGTSCRKSGVRSTHRISESKEFLEMAGRAFLGAFNDSGLGASDLDLLIFAGASKAQVLPCTAALIQEAVGHSGYGCFDVDATCLGFLRALQIATQFLSTKTYRNIAIVVAEGSSRHLNAKDPLTSPLFGDGAAAYILSASESTPGHSRSIARIATHFATYGEFAELCKLEGGLVHLPAWECTSQTDPRFLFQMKGKQLYATTAKLLPKHLHEFLDKEGLELDDFDWVVPHQASQSALNLMSSRLKIPSHKLVNIIEENGNQVAASLPIALHSLLSHLPPKSSVNILLIGTGAGFGIGLTILTLSA